MSKNVIVKKSDSYCCLQLLDTKICGDEKMMSFPKSW